MKAVDTSFVSCVRFSVADVLRTLVDDYCHGDVAQVSLDKVLLVSIQHVLSTTVDMFSVMKGLGLAHAVIGGKNYSTHTDSAEKLAELDFDYVEDKHQLGYGRFDDCMQEVVHEVWHIALEKMERTQFDLLIILDDGADLLRATPGALFNKKRCAGTLNRPEMIIGIEQTRGGTNHPLFSGLPFPIIDVAGSFAKAELEYPRVAGLIADQVISLVTRSAGTSPGYTEPVVGILGFGTMGKAVASRLVMAGYSVLAYDQDSNKQAHFDGVVHYNNASVLISNADIIVGCTGKDTMGEEANLSALLYSRRKKWLISTGSKDHEFNSLLHVIQNEVKSLGYMPDPLETIEYENHVGAVIEIVRGGFPVNFTNEAHSVPPEHIWPTRAALMLACLSAVRMRREGLNKFRRSINIFMLPTTVQLLILKKYCELNQGEQELIELSGLKTPELLDFIAERSDGLSQQFLLNNITPIKGLT